MNEWVNKYIHTYSVINLLVAREALREQSYYWFVTVFVSFQTFLRENMSFTTKFRVNSCRLKFLKYVSGVILPHSQMNNPNQKFLRAQFPYCKWPGPRQWSVHCSHSPTQVLWRAAAHILRIAHRAKAGSFWDSQARHTGRCAVEPNKAD